MRDLIKEAPFSMVPSTDHTGSFAINLDLGEIGALQITARKVWLVRLGDTTRLKEIAASVRRHLNLLPVEEPRSAPEPAPQKKLLALYENSADAAAAGRQKVGNPPMAVIAWPALAALTKPQGIEKIASALRNRQIAGWLLIAASDEGPAPAVAADWCRLENGVQQNGVLDIVALRQDGRMQVVKTNAERLAQLDQESAVERPALRQTDDEEPDPDPW